MGRDNNYPCVYPTRGRDLAPGKPKSKTTVDASIELLWLALDRLLY